jgi:hypothetical protein
MSLDWNVDLVGQTKKVNLDAKKKQFEIDNLYYAVFSSEPGQKLLAILQENIVNKIGYNGSLPAEKCFHNMLIRDAQAMLVQAFQAGVERIKKAPDLENYSQL